MTIIPCNLYDIPSTGYKYAKKNKAVKSKNISLFAQIGTIGTALIISSTPGLSLARFEYDFLPIKNSELSRINSKIIDATYQIEDIKNQLGLNISELAAILLVSRPTIYDWLNKSIDLQKKHRDRLYVLYNLSIYWSQKKMGRLANYLHKPLFNENLFLFNLLTETPLNKAKIEKFLDQLAQLILEKQQQDKLYQNILLTDGFKLASKEERDDRLNDITFLDL
ncbi:MAG: hypothetical protein ACK4PR_04420 [Gammaproteobacteria bacterium]